LVYGDGVMTSILDLNDHTKDSYVLSLYCLPSPGLDWSAPSKLFVSMLKNKMLFKSRPIGHTSIAISTRGHSPLEPILDSGQHLGMTQLKKSEGVQEVLIKGFGYGILNHTFKGRLETNRDLVPEITSRALRAGALSFINFQISAKQHEILQNYLTLYQQAGAHQSYGMRPDPLALEGGGCSAFAVASLLLCGLPLAELKPFWSRQHDIREDFIGTENRSKVSVFSLLSARNWEPVRSGKNPFVFFWDPDLIHRSLEDGTFERIITPSISDFSRNTLEFSPIQWQKAKGFLMNLRPFEKTSEELFAALKAKRLRLSHL